jgi:F-type H+-transporting ATPase subunit b
VNINITLIAQMVTFAVFIWFCWKYIWPPITSAMRERQEAIADGLAAAERAEKDLELAQSKATDQMREAKVEAQHHIDEARDRARQMVEAAKDDARLEGERLLEAARAEIDQEMNRAKEILRVQVAELALSGAEKVLGSSIDRSKHGALLDELAAEL